MSIDLNPTGPQSPASGTHSHSVARVNILVKLKVVISPSTVSITGNDFTSC